MMCSVKFLTLTFVCFVPICSGLSICGLETVDKCVPDDVKCLAVLDRALRSWFQSYEAGGYCIDPIDPYVIDELKFDVQFAKFIFRNVTITGLSRSVVMIENIPHFSGVRETYYHNLEVVASSYSVKDLKVGRNLNFPTPVKFYFSKAKVTSKVLLEPRDRCDRTTHLYLKPLETRPHGGQTNIISGFDPEHHDVKTGDFGMALLDNLVLTCTKQLYLTRQQTFSIIPYEMFFDDA